MVVAAAADGIIVLQDCGRQLLKMHPTTTASSSLGTDDVGEYMLQQ